MNTCVEDWGSCNPFDLVRKCCSGLCSTQTIRGAPSGNCIPGDTPKPTTPIPKDCIENGEVCKSDGSMGYCCSDFCLQQRTSETGFCSDRNQPTGTTTTITPSTGPIMVPSRPIPNGTSTSKPTPYDGGSSVGLIVGLTFVAIVIIGLLVAVLFLLLKMRRTMMTKADVYRFLRGDPGQGGRDLPVHEKVDNLPYDASYEILPSRFTIDNHILGSGQFGVVKRGSIRLLPNSDPLPVAVKTTGEGVELRYFKALLSELKLMIYIGSHENVVTLLGANTTDMKTGRAYLFLEFCKLGSLESFLRKNKHSFTAVGESSRPYANDPKYITIESSEHTLTTFDLYHWSTQIAQGLEFLSTKKVVHGDLATRNILLASRSLAKISDFGLSRRVYDYTNYVKKNQEPLPWKWMAIESLQELTFSTQSDIWGYGVTIWEIFSLGSTPYPGLSWSSNFGQEVVKGLRLPLPPYGTQKLYDLLLECWNLNPALRPRPETILRTLESINSSPP